MNPTPPNNDAARPGTGAGVNGENLHENRTTSPANPAPPVRRNARKPSRDAAEKIAPRTPKLRDMVRAVLRERGPLGATDQELQTTLGLESSTQIPRRWELVKSHEVVASRNKRPTRSGCKATVWVLAEFAAKPATPPAGASDAPARPEGGAA